MNAALQEAIKEAFAVAPTQTTIYDTLEIRQTGVQNPVYLVRAARGITAKDETGEDRYFEPSGFQFSLPPSTEEGFQTLNIAIDNIGQRVTDFLTAAKSEPVTVEVIYRPYVDSDLTTPQMDPPLVLYLKNVKANIMQVTGEATFMDIVNKKYPLELYTRNRFPTLG